MNTKLWTDTILVVWAVYRVVVAVAGYSFGYVGGFVVASLTGNVALAEAVGTWFGMILMYGVDLVLFVRAVRWLTVPAEVAQSDEPGAASFQRPRLLNDGHPDIETPVNVRALPGWPAMTSRRSLAINMEETDCAESAS